MKSVSSALRLHLEGDSVTLATLWAIERIDGVTLYLTDHDSDITYDGNTYEATSGYQRTAQDSTIESKVGSMEVFGIVDSDSITDEDMMFGRFDGARVTVKIVNWEDLSMGDIVLHYGILSELKMLPTGAFSAELRGLKQNLLQNTQDLFSPTCRADLGDSKCMVDLGKFETQVTVVSSIDSRFIIIDSAVSEEAEYVGGSAIFTSGPNSGRAMEIVVLDGTDLILSLPMPNEIEAGNLITLNYGCDKRLTTCANKFSNVENFRGEPFVPGPYSALNTIVPGSGENPVER